MTTSRFALLPLPPLPCDSQWDCDHELVARLASGDRHALAELQARYGARIQRFVRCLAGVTPELAEDIAQQVMIEVARCAARFEARSRLSTWLFGMARNLCRTELRRREDAIEPTASVWTRLPDPGRDPHELFERSEATEAVRRALESLPPALRAVLVLREWEDMTYDQIAEVVGIPVGTVRSRLHAARALLAQRLIELLGGRDDRL